MNENEKQEQILAEIRACENIMQQSLVDTISTLSSMMMLQASMLMANDTEQNAELQSAHSLLENFVSVHDKWDALKNQLNDTGAIA